jgi:hypothetical protein
VVFRVFKSVWLVSYLIVMLRSRIIWNDDLVCCVWYLQKKWWYYCGLSLYCSSFDFSPLFLLNSSWTLSCCWRLRFRLFNSLIDEITTNLFQISTMYFKFFEVFNITSIFHKIFELWFLSQSRCEFELTTFEVGLLSIRNKFMSCRAVWCGVVDVIPSRVKLEQKELTFKNHPYCCVYLLTEKGLPSSSSAGTFPLPQIKLKK